MVPKSSTSIDQLLIYAVWQILQSGEECTFERLVCECFTRFPESFSLKRYPQWPDSDRVNKAWLRCRTDKGWLAGSRQHGFRLTAAGEHVARKVAAQLFEDTGQSPASGPSGPRARERYEALLRNIRRDPLFQRFIGSQGSFHVSEMEFRSLLGATLETPPRVLRQNLTTYKNAARDYQDHEVYNFLIVCEQKMASVIKPAMGGRQKNG